MVFSIQVTAPVQPVLDASKERVSAIVKAWSTLQDAAAKKDKPAYLAAETTLKQTYADLGAISDVSDTQVNAEVAKLIQALSSIK